MATTFLAAALVAGCGGGGGGSSSSSTSVNGIKPVAAPTCAPVEYQGSGTPKALIVSDLPMRGDSAERSSQQVEAIRLALDDANWKAGATPVAFQACDDSIAKTGLWDAKTCKANASAYAADRDVLSVIGTYNSGCAALEIPILNRAGLAMVSPGNTDVCLTEPAETCTGGNPDSLYPSGRRNYARVVPNDAVQGAALAEFARQQGVSRPFVLYASDDPTSTGQATNFRNAATKIGLDVAGYKTWDQDAKSYGTLMKAVRASGADAVVLAGLLEENGAQIIKDKVSVLGPNDGKVKLLAFDGFAQQSTIDSAGGGAAGMFASVPGKAPSELTGAGKAFVDQLSKQVGDHPVELFAPYAGQAADLVLRSIDGGGATRSGTVKAVFSTPIRDGIVGSFRIEPSGDPSVAPITVSIARSSFEPTKEIAPPASVVAAARG